LDNVSIITVAPELEGMYQTIPQIKEKSIIVSAGHSEATFDQAQKAVDAGVTLITHLFNAMIPFHHRDPGLVGLLGTKHKQIYFGMIVDGVHSHRLYISISRLILQKDSSLLRMQLRPWV